MFCDDEGLTGFAAPDGSLGPSVSNAPTNIVSCTGSEKFAVATDALPDDVVATFESLLGNIMGSSCELSCTGTGSVAAGGAVIVTLSETGSETVATSGSTGGGATDSMGEVAVTSPIVSTTGAAGVILAISSAGGGGVITVAIAGLLVVTSCVFVLEVALLWFSALKLPLLLAEPLPFPSVLVLPPPPIN